MTRTNLFLAAGLAVLLSGAGGYTAFGGEQLPNGKMQQKLSESYPSHKLVQWCSGRLVGKDANAVALLRNEAKKHYVVAWVMSQGGIQELDSIVDSSSDFEIECLDAKQAKERDYVLQNSETINGSLKPPKGLGAFCYFTDETFAKCWSLDRTSGKLIVVGGWET